MSPSRRVLLLNPPGTKMYARDKYCASVSKADYYWPAVDFVFQSGYLSRKHQVAVIDAIVEKLGPRDVLRRMKHLKPDAVLFLTSSASWPEDMAFMEQAKSVVQFEAVALGGWLLPLAEQALSKFFFLDAVLLDFACDDLARWLSGDRPVFNMVWRDGNKIVKGERFGEDGFEVPTPRHDLLPLHKYRFPLARHKSFTVTNTTVGCPWKCRFCVPGTVKFRSRTTANVMEELRAIRDLGIREILFHDATFTAGKKRVTELMESMIEGDLGLDWMCQARVDTVDSQLLKLMKRAGCHGIEFGVESGSERVLDSMDKQVGRETIEQAFAIAREEGIHTNAFFIIGMPGETEEDIEATIAFAKKLKPTVASFSVPMPHPGTPLGADEDVTGRFIDEGLAIDDVSPPKIHTGKIAPERVWQLRNRAMMKFYLDPAYIVRKFMDLRSLHDFTRDAKLAISLFKGLLKPAGGSFLSRAESPTRMSGLLESVECPLCGFEAEDYGTERGYDLKTCSHCSLVFVHPMPEKEELQKYYEGVHEQIHPQVWSRHGERVRVEILAGLKKKLPTGRVLDVGSGAGHFLDMLKNAGYDAYGVEPAADVSPNGPVLAHHISDLNKNAGPFDAIVMMWALEHMPDPDAAISKAREMLKPGGILVVRVPNMGFIKPIHRLKVLEKMFPRFFKSLINPASNKLVFFELLGPPYHLYGYSPSTVRRLMEGQGFKLERIGIDGGLSTGKGLRDGLDKILEFTARVIYAVSGGRIVFFYDLTAWARKGQGAF